MFIKPVKRIKANRKARKAAKRNWQELPAETQVEVSMNSAVLVQIVLGIVRHAMTALAPLGLTLSDDALIQVSTVIVTLLGLAWSAVRKVKAAKSA